MSPNCICILRQSKPTVVRMDNIIEHLRVEIRDFKDKPTRWVQWSWRELIAFLPSWIDEGGRSCPRMSLNSVARCFKLHRQHNACRSLHRCFKGEVGRVARGCECETKEISRRAESFRGRPGRGNHIKARAAWRFQTQFGLPYYIPFPSGQPCTRGLSRVMRVSKCQHDKRTSTTSVNKGVATPLPTASNLNLPRHFFFFWTSVFIM
jgi:hypothetical protein